MDVNEIWSEHRRYLVDLAFRMLGSLSEAEDAVQEAFMRLLKVDLDQSDDVRGWLVTVTGRLCLDRMKSARARHETGVELPLAPGADTVAPPERGTADG